MKIRDLTFIKTDNGFLVIACDSCGGIGSKKYDQILLDPFYVGALTTRVAIIESLCVKAKIIAVVNNVCNEMNPTGNRIIRGIKHEISKLKNQKIEVTGSTEDNFNTLTTAVGITVISKLDKISFKKIKSNYYVWLVGEPKVGNEIDVYNTQFVDYETVENIVSLEHTIVVVPCGSKGVLHECDLLSKDHKLEFILTNKQINVTKSCGPASCLVVVSTINKVKQFKNFDCKISLLGYFK